jgi:acetyl esterase/lipase
MKANTPILAIVSSLVFLSICQAQPPFEEVLRRHDKDKDGRLSRDEFPQQALRIFDRIDSNKDGIVTAEEDAAFRRARLQRRPRPRRRPPLMPLRQPDHADVKYGPHERNVFDLWLAETEEPPPLVIYYHGGGFRGGDKRSINRALLDKLLDGGVSVAAVNYRLSDTAPFPAQMHDCARALQYIRLHAKDYNIDPHRIGATGGSAGAGISQWLAFHDDLADPDSDDPVKQQSTRISCAVVYAAQTSYDPRFIKKLFDTDQVDGALIPFFGMESAEDVDDPKFHPLFEESAPINHATADDPPVMLFYPQRNDPLPPNSGGGQHIHHPKFGFALKERLDKLGVECVVKLREDYPEQAGRIAPVDDYVAFLFEKLAVKK